MKWLLGALLFFQLHMAHAVAPAADVSATMAKISALEILMKDAKSTEERFNIYRDMLSNYALIYNQTQLGKDKLANYRKKARELCDQGLALKDLNVEQKAILIHNQAQTWATEEPKKALEFFSEALKLSTSYPGSTGALLMVAEDLYEHDHQDQALSYYKLLRGRPGIPANYVEMKYAYSCLKTKNFAEAEKSFITVAKKSNENAEVDGAIEGLATTTSFSKSEEELVKLSSSLFWSQPKKQIAFLKSSLKKRWAVNPAVELKIFDKIFSVTSDTQEIRKILLDLFDIPAGTLKPEMIVAYLQRYQSWTAKKGGAGSPEAVNKSNSGSGGMEALVYQQLAAAYANSKKTGKVSTAEAKDLTFLAGFYLSFFPNGKNKKDVTLMRTDLCRMSGDFACLGKIANEAPDKSISNTLRLSLALEAALGGHPISEVTKIKDQALLVRVAEEMKGEKLWRQVMPYLIERELKSGDKARALKWATALESQFPHDPEAQQWRSAALAAQTREEVKNKNWSSARQNIETVLSRNALKPKEQSEFLSNALANMLLEGQYEMASDIYAKHGGLMQNSKDLQGVLKAFMKNAIARAQWDACLGFRNRVTGPAKDLEFEKTLCQLGKNNGRFGEFSINWQALRRQDIDYLADALSLTAPESLIGEKKWPQSQSQEHQKALFFAFQNSQQSLFPALTEDQFLRVQQVAPNILRASASSRLETSLQTAKFPNSLQNPQQFLKETLSLSKKGEDASRQLKAGMSKMNVREQARTLKTLADFETKLAQAMDRGPSFSGMSAAEKAEYQNEMKSLAEQHRAQAQEYLQAYEAKQQEQKQFLVANSEEKSKITDSSQWRWPQSNGATQVKKAAQSAKFFGALIALDFARPVFKMSDEEYLMLRSLTLFTRSKNDALNVRITRELQGVGQETVLRKCGLVFGVL